MAPALAAGNGVVLKPDLQTFISGGLFMGKINDQSVNSEPTIAFSGEKASGVGRYGGEWSMEEFTTPRWVSVQKRPHELPF